MALSRTLAIFTAKGGDGIGTLLKTIMPDSTIRPGASKIEKVIIEIRGTWSGVTVKPQISLAYNQASPSVFTNVQHIKDDGTLTDIAITADTVFALDIPSKTHFTLIVSGSGSPIPSLNAWAHGDVEAA